MGDVLELDTVEEFEDGRDGGDREVAVVEAMDDGMSDLKDKGENIVMYVLGNTYRMKPDGRNM